MNVTEELQGGVEPRSPYEALLMREMSQSGLSHAASAIWPSSTVTTESARGLGSGGVRFVRQQQQAALPQRAAKHGQ